MARRNQILAGFGFVATLFLTIFLVHPASSSISSLVSKPDGMIQDPSATIWDPLVDYSSEPYGNGSTSRSLL